MTSEPAYEWDAFVFQFDGKEQTAFWKANRKQILKDFIADHPGQRPYFWWMLDAPEPRKRVKGTAVEKEHHETMAYYYGVPSNDTFYELGIDKERIKEADFESELEYLKRLNLLTKEEKKLLKHKIR